MWYLTQSKPSVNIKLNGSVGRVRIVSAKEGRGQLRPKMPNPGQWGRILGQGILGMMIRADTY